MLCKPKTGYISNLGIYTAQGNKLSDTVMSVLEDNSGIHCHVYHVIIIHFNFYNAVILVQNLLKHKLRICGTVRLNIGIL
jgi:hypothetical protein